MSKLMSGIVLATGICCSVQANANSIYSVADPLGFGVSALGTPHQVSPGAFVDTINFSVLDASTLVGGVSSLELAIGTSAVFSITNLGMSLYTSDGVLLGSGSSFTVPGNQVGGNFYVNIFGTAIGGAGGMYAAALSVSPVPISPVPEPEIFSMIGLGLGLIGVATSRRKKLNQTFC